MEIIAVILLGIVAGYVGKLLMPGKDPGGFFVTILLGLAGSFVGFFLFRAIGIGDDDKFDWGGILGAIIGTMILLGLYRVFMKDRVERGGPDRPAAAARR